MDIMNASEVVALSPFSREVNMLFKQFSRFVLLAVALTTMSAASSVPGSTTGIRSAVVAASATATGGAHNVEGAAIDCWHCDSFFNGAQVFNHCSTMGFAIIGYPDCFGPMIPSLPCSMYGEPVYCFGEDQEELLLSAGSFGLDGSVNLQGLREEMFTPRQQALHESAIRAAAEKGHVVVRSCTGIILGGRSTSVRLPKRLAL